MKTKTRRIKTGPISDSQMVNALKNSMGPIFQHFEEELSKYPEKVLWIECKASPGQVNLKYGISDPAPASNAEGDTGITND